MHGWMDGWVAGGRVGGWVGAWMDVWKDGWMGGWMDGWINVRTPTCVHVPFYANVCIRLHGLCVHIYIHTYISVCVCVSAFVFGGMQAGMHTYIDVLFTHACVLYATSDSYAENIQHSSHHGHKDD